MNEIEAIKEAVAPLVEESGYILKGVSVETMEKRRSVVVTIASNDGPITANDCAKVSRRIDPVLEEKGLIGENSFLVVSSPGI